VPLELVDCPGRSLAGCAVDLIRHEAELPGAEVTVILPRQKHRGADRPDRPRSGLPDGMAGQIAQELGQASDVAVMIIAPPEAASWSPGRSQPS